MQTAVENLTNMSSGDSILATTSTQGLIFGPRSRNVDTYCSDTVNPTRRVPKHVKSQFFAAWPMTNVKDSPPRARMELSGISSDMRTELIVMQDSTKEVASTEELLRSFSDHTL